MDCVVGVFPWSAIIIVACKELFMVIGGLLMLKNDVVVYSNYVGKAAQVCFILSLVLAFFHDELAARGVQLDIILLWITVALALCAMVIYIIGSVRTIRKRKAEGGEQA